jgi:PBP1b-binding outer membrane lipoprotein LpoB
MMKRHVVGVILLGVGVLGGCSDNSVPSAAQQSEAAVEARIKPVGEVAMALPSPPAPTNGVPSSAVVTPPAPAP